MRRINPFFLIGMLGMLFTSMFHVVIGAIASEEAASSGLSIFYPIFSIFLILGTAIMAKRKSPLKE